MTPLAAADNAIERSFALVRENNPAVAPGALINKANADQYHDYLDAGMMLALRNGWYEIKVGPGTSFDVDKAFIAATEKETKKSPARLGDKPGEIIGYTGGRPFPEEPQSSDPRAGEKSHGIFAIHTAMVAPSCPFSGSTVVC